MCISIFLYSDFCSHNSVFFFFFMYNQTQIVCKHFNYFQEYYVLLFKKKRKIFHNTSLFRIFYKKNYMYFNEMRIQ